MKIKILLIILLVSLGMSGSANAAIYRLDATSTDPSGHGDFFVTYNDTGDNLFSFNELQTFSGVVFFSGPLTHIYGGDGLSVVPTVLGFTLGGEVNEGWRFINGVGVRIASISGWNYSVTAISAVPVPAALPLFGTGLALLGLVGWHRRRRASASACSPSVE